MLLSKAIYIAFNEHSIHAFPGNWTHDLGIPNAMLYRLSYRITMHNKITQHFFKWNEHKKKRPLASVNHYKTHTTPIAQMFPE